LDKQPPVDFPLQTECCLSQNFTSEEFSCPIASVLRCVLHSEGSFENDVLIEGQANLQLVVKEINMDVPKLTAATNSCALGGGNSTVLSQRQSSCCDVLAS